jgi:hypothetical protein
MFTFGWFDRFRQSTVPAFGANGRAPGASRRWSASGKKWDLGSAAPAAAPVDPRRGTITANAAIVANALNNLRVVNLDLPLFVASTGLQVVRRS